MRNTPLKVQKQNFFSHNYFELCQPKDLPERELSADNLWKVRNRLDDDFGNRLSWLQDRSGYPGPDAIATDLARTVGRS